MPNSRPELVLFVTLALGATAAGACDDEARTISNLVEHGHDVPDVVSADAADVTASDSAVTTTGDSAATGAETVATHSDTALDSGPPDTTDTTVTNDTALAETTPETGETTEPPAPIDINEGFIGGACAAVGDCDFESAICLGDAAGWPGGECTEACTKLCPDGVGMATTFCVDGGPLGTTGGICVQQCDFGESPTGCRQDYMCVDEERFGDPATSKWVCLPGNGTPEFTACIEQLIARGIGFELSNNPMDYPDGHPEDVCDVLDPIFVDGVINGVEFHPNDFTSAPKRMFVTCPVALALYDMAELGKSRGITDFVHLGTYNCRYISGTETLSEHAFANAIDIAGVKNADGEFTLLDDWEDGNPNPATTGGELLYWLAHAMHAEKIWNIILPPEYNAAHDNHFHVDLTEGSDFLSE